MSVVMQPLALDLSLPWEENQEQEARFQKLLKILLLLLLLLFIIIPRLPVFEKPFEETESDITITKVILPPVKPEPVPQPQVQKKQPPKEIVKEVPKTKEELKPEPKAATIKKPTNDKSGSAKKTAVKAEKIDDKIAVQSSQGLNELSSQLSSLRSSLDLSKMQNKNLSNNTTGSAARSPKQLLGSDQLSQKSGGIGNVDDSVMKSASTSLADHTTTAVDGLVESGTGPSGNQSYFSSRKGLRDMESIRLTFERAKSRVDSIYQRALRETPDLSGQFIFTVVIEPDGSISDLKLVSSELGFNDLEREILSKIQQLNFGAKDVAATALEYKYTFIPPV